jgi:glutathione synthase/RimK-type ligase-like ATP-grasp enzyme
MKQKIIVTGGNGRPSAEAVFPLLKTKPVYLYDRRIGDNGEIFRIYENNLLKKNLTRVPFRKVVIKDGIVIRWANAIQFNHHGCIVYNEAAAIMASSAKGKAREALGKAGVDIPKLVTVDNFKKEDLPILARPRTHMKCHGMVLLETKEKFTEHYNRLHHKGWYYSQMIWKDREIRIHVAHGKVLLIADKSKPANPKTLGWGHAVVNQEWTVLHWDEYREAWCKKACDAVKAFGLDFGAVDLIIKDKKSYVLEVNTGGCLSESEYTRTRYAKYFDWLFRSEKRREWWDYSKFTAGASFAWKNFQLEDKKEPIK